MDADSWRQAKSVLEAALLCPPAERDAFIAGRCGDPSLRREVLACLNEHDDHFLESALTISHTFEHATSTDDVEAPPDVEPGERIGRYEVVGRLGAGGMGHVFLGNDTELQRKVALKCLIASASAADIRSRILHEARAAARINHPNIAVVHDVVEHDGRPFLVMEYVEGENLAQSLKRERPPLEKILAIGRQLASALTAAHAKGIIHRDLKPANIQVMPDGSVKILDFGVAHALAADPEPASGATTAAGVPLSTLATMRTERGAIRHPGTPAYMSPEQMFGKPIDQRSDIYSLGVILYEMSTGHRPYATDDPLDVVLALSRNLLRPSGAETHLPEAVNDVIGKMLAVELEQRYQTAAEVETALVALMAPELAPPVPARSVWLKVLQATLRIIGVLVAAAAGVVALGFVQTMAFNLTLGRIAPFDQESRFAWLEYGGRSLVTPAVYLIGIFIVMSAARFAVRVLSLSRGIESLLTNGATHTARLSSRLSLNDPVVFGQAVAGVGFVLLATAILHFWPFILAFATVSISTKPLEQFFPLQLVGQSQLDVQRYRQVLTLIIFGLGVGLVRIMRLRATLSLPRGGSALAIVTTMLVFAIVLCQAPYRIVWQSEMPRVEVAGERCLVIGENRGELLVHCPNASIPRNRIVERADPAVRLTGQKQNIFSPPETFR